MQELGSPTAASDCTEEEEADGQHGSGSRAASRCLLFFAALSISLVATAAVWPSLAFVHSSPLAQAWAQPAYDRYAAVAQRGLQHQLAGYRQWHPTWRRLMQSAEVSSLPPAAVRRDRRQ
jgi:hypothetical protein